MSTYFPRVAITTQAGGHLRFVPAAVARAMVDGGSAAPQLGVGRVRTVSLTRPASTHAQRIGEPSDSRASGVRFYRWVHLEQSGARIVEHHPRCCIFVDTDA